MDFNDEAKEILRKEIHAGLFDPNDMREAIATALRKAYVSGQEDMRKRSGQSVPSNWVDSLLTGDGVPKLPYNCPEIERLLMGVRDRIRSLPTLQSNTEKEMG